MSELNKTDLCNILAEESNEEYTLGVWFTNADLGEPDQDDYLFVKDVITSIQEGIKNTDDLDLIDYKELEQNLCDELLEDQDDMPGQTVIRFCVDWLQYIIENAGDFNLEDRSS